MSARPQSLPDAPPRNWFEHAAPDWLKPYSQLARWDRPIGWQLLLWPCWWSVALAAIAADRRLPDAWHLLLFLVGAIEMRGAGCTYNDLVDRDLDGRVERTRLRPLPSGAIRPRRALAFLVLQALTGLVVLLQFNGFTVLLGLASLAIVAIYPFMKRITDWPQVVLGFAFSWGALMGWAAEFGRLTAAPLLLYAGSVLWTIAYDTVYALQDKEDDALIGVRSTARLFGDHARLAIAGFYTAGFVLMAAGLVFADAGPFAFAGVGAALLHSAWQVARLDIADPRDCLRRFRANSRTGAIVFAGLVLDAALRL